MIALILADSDPHKAVLAFIFTLAGMYLLLMFANIGNLEDTLQWPRKIIVWALTLMFIGVLGMTLSAFMWGVPEGWAKWLGAPIKEPLPDATHWFEVVTGGNVPVAAAMIDANIVSVDQVVDTVNGRAIHRAAELCNPIMVEMLIAKGAAINLRKASQQQPSENLR